MREEENESEEGAVEDDYGSGEIDVFGEISFRRETSTARSALGGFRRDRFQRLEVALGVIGCKRLEDEKGRE